MIFLRYSGRDKSPIPANLALAATKDLRRYTTLSFNSPLFNPKLLLKALHFLRALLLIHQRIRSLEQLLEIQSLFPLYLKDTKTC